LSFERNLLARLKTLRGVRSAAAINVLPLGGQNNYPTQQEGHPENSIGGMEYRLITPRYFETMEIPVLRGRAFNSGGVRGWVSVVLINETLARQAFPGSDPIGKRIRLPFVDASTSFAQVIGVVAAAANSRTTALPDCRESLSATTIEYVNKSLVS